MSRFGASIHNTLFDGAASLQTSTYTSNWIAISEFASMSLSVETSNTAASLHTAQFSNDNGMQGTAIREGSVSNATVLVAKGIFTIDPGPRWMRVLRSSLDSASTVNLTAWVS